MIRVIYAASPMEQEAVLLVIRWFRVRPPGAPPAISPPRQPAAELTQWADTVLRREYGGYQLPACWASHPHAIWELFTLAAEWHRIYSRKRPDLNRALEFHDRWLPGTMRRITDMTRRCNPDCITRQRTPKRHTAGTQASRKGQDRKHRQQSQHVPGADPRGADHPARLTQRGLHLRRWQE